MLLQLARAKAAELEDFSSSGSSSGAAIVLEEPRLDPETEEGMRLVEEFLMEFSASTSAARSDEDVDMDGGDEDGDVRMQDEDATDSHLEALKQCLEKYRGRMENNKWVMGVVGAL